MISPLGQFFSLCNSRSASQKEMQSPLYKVVFIQKVAAFAPKRSLLNFIELAHVNQSWADTIQNYSSHLIEDRASAEDSQTCDNVLRYALKCDAIWLLDALLSKPFLDRSNRVALRACETPCDFHTTKFVLDKIKEVGGLEQLKVQLSSTYTKCTVKLATFGIHRSDHAHLSQKIKLVLETSLEVEGGAELFVSLFSAVESDFRRHCLFFLCYESPSYCSAELLKFICGMAAEAGGSEFLSSQLSRSDTSGWNCLTYVLCGGGSSAQKIKLIATLLHHFDCFQMLYDRLKDFDKVNIQKQAGIDSSSWTPDAESIEEVKEVLRPGYVAKIKKVEEEAAARKNMIEEEKIARNKKIEDEADTRRQKVEEEISKRKAEDEAAARRKMFEEETASRNKAVDEEAAIRRQKVEEKAAYKKKVDGEAAARKNMIEEEMIARKRTVDEEATSRSQKVEEEGVRRKAEEEAATRKAMIEEEAAARTKTMQEEAAVRRQTAEENASGKTHIDERTAARKKMIEEEAVARKRTGEEEAAARWQTAEEETVARKIITAKEAALQWRKHAEHTCKLVAIVGIVAAVTGIAVFTLKKSSNK